MLRRIVTASLVVLLLAAAAVAMNAAPIDPSADWPGEFSSGSYMGIDVQDVTADRMAALKLKEERGVEVTMVDQDAPAGKAGLKEHDVILDFNGSRVEGAEQLRRMIRETPPGRKVTVGISRNGQPMQLAMQLADRRQAMRSRLPMPPIPPFPPMVMQWADGPRAISRCGLAVDNLTPQLGEFFGVKNGAGVLVRSVEKGSAADAAGFRAGDVIVRVENERINDKADWRSALRAHPTGKINVGIVRDKREQTLSVTLPAPKDDESRIEIQIPDIREQVEGIELALNRMRPEIERINRQVVVDARKVMERNRKDLENAQKNLEQQLEKAKPELEKQMNEIEKQFEDMGREIRITVADD